MVAVKIATTLSEEIEPTEFPNVSDLESGLSKMIELPSIQFRAKWKGEGEMKSPIQNLLNQR